jgi:hypothetical protein
VALGVGAVSNSCVVHWTRCRHSKFSPSDRRKYVALLCSSVLS